MQEVSNWTIAWTSHRHKAATTKNCQPQRSSARAKIGVQTVGFGGADFGVELEFFCRLGLHGCCMY
jgi:hypothetical protein